MAKFIRPDMRIIALDETSDWELPEYKDKIERIETVYIFDANLNIHICSFTSNYECYHVETRAILKPEFQDDERLSDEISNVIHKHDTTEEVSYLTCYDIDNTISKYLQNPDNRCDFRYAVLGDPFPEILVKEYKELYNVKENGSEFYREFAQSCRENTEL